MNEPSSSVMFRCDKCSAVIKGESAFWNHLSTQHFEYYPYRCGYCAETGEIHSTTTEDKMKHHMETVHRVKDLKISIHKKHDIETQLQTIVDKCRPNTENSPAGLKSALRQVYNVLDEGLHSSIRSSDIREAISRLPKQRESSVEASETTIGDTTDTIDTGNPLPRLKLEEGFSVSESLRNCYNKLSDGSKMESLTKDQDHNKRTILANESNLLSDDAPIFTLPEKQSYGEFPVTSTTSKTRGKLISITAVDEDFNQYQQYSTETAIQTAVQSSSYNSVAKPMQRKRSLPINDRNNRMQTTSKRSIGISKGTNSTGMLYQCDRCSFASANKSYLVTHTRIHTGEKPFKCDQCAFASAHKSALDRHVRTHTGEKPFKCDQCSYASAQKGNLDNHVRTHTGEKPFKCSQCSFATAHKSYLNRHVRIHTNEKPFKCDQCSFASAHKSSLDRHVRTHAGEKPCKFNQKNLC
ncbi:c2H2-type zinc-finger domain-containing protein [Ditylenchus destructor]|nr:c2H2-type zinc-finger domain-containing protein [Ditylenchus destructor]